MAASKLKKSKCDCAGGGYSYFIRDTEFVDGDWVPIWKCENCGHTLPRRVRRHGTGRTPSQDKAIECVRDALLEKNGRYSDREQVLKKFEVTDMDWGSVSLVIEVGSEGDEGTLGSIFCRDYRHIFIGRSGGLKLVNAKAKSKSRGFHNVVWGATR